jgi:hypothetical protein
LAQKRFIISFDKVFSKASAFSKPATFASVYGDVNIIFPYLFIPYKSASPKLVLGNADVPKWLGLNILGFSDGSNLRFPKGVSKL